MITFPLTAQDFFAKIKIRSMAFELSENTVSSVTGAGEVIRAKLGPSLWRGTVSGVVAYHEDAADVEVLLDMLRRPGSSFLVYDNRFNGPALDPGGEVLGAATPSIAQIDATRREMRLEGLPSGYTLRRGDYIGFTTASGSRALHRVVEPIITANVAGETNLFEVGPVLRPGAAVGQAVSLVRPVCRAIVDPNSIQIGRGDLIFTQGITFNWTQTLK